MATERTRMRDLQPTRPTVESFYVHWLWTTWAIPIAVETWRWRNGYRDEIGSRHFGIYVGPIHARMTVRFRKAAK